MALKVCPVCGDTFNAHGNQKYCGKEVHGTCPVCGNPVVYKCGQDVPVCSKRCSHKKAKIPKYSCTCVNCGDTFLSFKKTAKYCKQEKTGTCPICGKLVTYTCYGDNIPMCCSDKCLTEYKRRRQAEERALKKFNRVCVLCGKHFVSNSPAIKNAVCSDKHYFNCIVCGRPFEIHSPNHSKTCSDACRIIHQSREYKKNSDKWVKKRQATCMKRYGVINYTKTDECKRRIRQTSLDRYGVPSFTKTEEFITKTKQTNLDRYGKEWHQQTDEHKRSVRETNMLKYGSDNVSRSKYFLTRRMSDPSKVEALMSFRENPEEFVRINFDHKPTLSELSSVCGVVESSIGYILNTRNLSDVTSYHFSKAEDELYEFLTNSLPDVDIQRNTFKVITPLELDIYLPELNLGIEMNPTYTHNSTKGIRGTEGKLSDYHLNKTIACESKGIFLFHIFGYDWTWRRNIIQSMILNLCGVNKDRIYARNTTVREVSYKAAKSFLDTNHRQGNCTSSVRLGLFYNEELVSLMTFSKMRHTMGTSSEDLSDCVELTRFCSLLNTSVVGGASKLFSYYVKNYNPIRVRSFSDRAHTRGDIYRKLGFNLIHINGPSYRWVNPMTDESLSRVSTQKRFLTKLLGNENVDESKTEVEIMEQNGWVRVYDCGTILWEWCKCK